MNSKILVTGACGFVGNAIIRALLERAEGIEIAGMDNYSRPGSEINRISLRDLGVRIVHGDIRNWSDIADLPQVDWVIDAAANPSVLAGADGSTSSRQLVEHNLHGTLNILEYCKRVKAGLVLLSTSRVYSIPALASLPLVAGALTFEWDEKSTPPKGASRSGLDVDFSTAPPVSLYGSTKLASELVALEYGHTFSFPVWINRCGVMAGRGQFGTAEQGIFSYWIHAYAQKRPLKYIGFEGSGRQVRDALHPDDLADLICRQIEHPDEVGSRIFNVGGGPQNAMSLAQLTAWCAERFGEHTVQADSVPRAFDVPWVVMDNRRASEQFNWSPKRNLVSILDEIANHAVANPHWLELSSTG